MELFINGEKVGLDGPRNENLPDFIHRISREYVPLNEVITEFVVDGKVLNSEDEPALSGRTTEGIAKLEIATANPAQITREGLQDALGYMDRLIPGLTEIAELYRRDDIPDAVHRFILAIEGIHWFASLISMGERYSTLKYRKEKVHQWTIADHYKELGDIVREISLKQESKEWEEVADLLEQKLVPHFETWKRILPEMINAVSGEAE